MSLLKINKTELVEIPVKTTPENVKEANEALFCAKMTLPAAAKHCGMTHQLILNKIFVTKYFVVKWCNEIQNHFPLLLSRRSNS
jgi:hypothetical protein